MKLSLDFRTKLLMTAVVAYVMVTGDLYSQAPGSALLCYLVPGGLLLSEKKYTLTGKWFLTLLVAGIIQRCVTPSTGLAVTMVMFLTYIILKMGPGFMLARYALSSTSVSDMVWSLKKSRIPDEIVIPVIVMARFFYTVREDYRQVREAMMLNGLTGWKLLRHPSKFLEYRFVPLFMCLSKTADEVSVSAMTRGLRPGQKRSSISTARFHVQDILFLLLTAALLGQHIALKHF